MGLTSVREELEHLLRQGVLAPAHPAQRDAWAEEVLRSLRSARTGFVGAVAPSFEEEFRRAKSHRQRLRLLRQLIREVEARESGRRVAEGRETGRKPWSASRFWAKLSLFASYDPADAERVGPVLEALRKRGAIVLDPNDALRPGFSWEWSILRLLTWAEALVLFLSRNSRPPEGIRGAAGTLPMVSVLLDPTMDEGNALVEGNHRRVAPVVEGYVHLPHEPGFVAGRILEILDLLRAAPRPAKRGWGIPAAKGRGKAEPSTGPLKPKVRRDLWSHLASWHSSRALARFEEHRSPRRREKRRKNRQVFVVHGHDEDLLRHVTRFLRGLSLEPIVLREEPRPGTTIFNKLKELHEQCDYAIVLLTPDDYGASRRDYEHPKGGEHALQFRARQNVLFEMGIMMGRLGFQDVFVLEKPPELPVPRFDLPSDLAGVEFVRFDDEGHWKDLLREQLREAGYKL